MNQDIVFSVQKIEDRRQRRDRASEKKHALDGKNDVKDNEELFEKFKLRRKYACFEK